MKRIILILLILFSLNSFSQDLKYASFNILTNSIIGGIGSGIHKKSGETFGHAFVQGMLVGAASGALNYGSKKMLQVQAGKNELDWRLCWGSKLVNSVSNTLLYNATMNERDFIGNYSINIGFLRLSTRYKVQVEPVSAGSFAFIFIKGAKFNVNRSIITGIPCFDYKFKREVYFDGVNVRRRDYRSGISYGQNIISHIVDFNSVANELNTVNVITHEMIHTYQRVQYSNVNNLFKIYNKYENFKWIHNDLSSIELLYIIQPYKYNEFEIEANYFGNLR